MQQPSNLENDVENKGENAEMDNMLCDLIDIHKVKGNEEALKRVLQSIYSLLDHNEVRFGPKLFEKLISVVIADTHNLYVNPEQITKVLDAVQVHVRQFPWLGADLLRKLSWISLCQVKNGADDQQLQMHPHAGQILEHMLEDFVRELGTEYTCSSQLFTVIQQLLQSDVNQNRNIAYSIMKKLLATIQKCAAMEQERQNTNECITYTLLHWPAYIVILEQLEQPESHLVLPMLSGQLPRFVADAQNDNWRSWLRILYVRLLFNKSILVVRWILNYFLMYSTIPELRRVNLLTEFLNVINRTELYDAEDCLLPEGSIRTFVQTSGTLQFLEALVMVQWQSLPLLHWLRSLPPRLPHIAKALLLKISERVKSLQHENLRFEAQKKMFDLFEPTIDSLALGDYIQFIKALCDNFCRDHKRCASKIANCLNIATEIIYFDRYLYTLIYRTDVSIGIELHKQLSLLPRAQHGWWRLYSFFFSLKLECPNERLEILKFYRAVYDLHIEVLEQLTDLNELQRYLIDRLNCTTEDEISFVTHRSVDWFACEKLSKWQQMEELKLKPLELLNQGTILTAQRIASLLKDIDARLEDESILKVLLAFLKQYPDSVLVATGLLKYATMYLPQEESFQILSDVLELSPTLNVNILSCTKRVSLVLIMRGILSGSPLSNAKCIEYNYLINQYNYFFTSCRKRDSYIKFVIDGNTDLLAVVDELLRVNIEMFEKVSHYVDHSREHRIRIRIARALLKITYKYSEYWSDQLWLTLLVLNDQLCLKYIYECLVARCLPNVDALLKWLQQLDTLKTCQQLSFISVLHIYCLSKCSKIKLEQLQKIVDLLLPQTMTQDADLRTFTQLVLHRLLTHFEDNNIKLPGLANMKLAIECNLGDKQLECQSDARLLLPKICYQTADGMQVADYILYMTCAPCEEYFADSLRPNVKLKSELDKIRNTFRLKSVST